MREQQMKLCLCLFTFCLAFVPHVGAQEPVHPFAASTEPVHTSSGSSKPDVTFFPTSGVTCVDTGNAIVKIDRLGNLISSEPYEVAGIAAQSLGCSSNDGITEWNTLTRSLTETQSRGILERQALEKREVAVALADLGVVEAMLMDEVIANRNYNSGGGSEPFGLAQFLYEYRGAEPMNVEGFIRRFTAEAVQRTEEAEARQRAITERQRREASGQRTASDYPRSKTFTYEELFPPEGGGATTDVRRVGQPTSSTLDKPARGADGIHGPANAFPATVPRSEFAIPEGEKILPDRVLD